MPYEFFAREDSKIMLANANHGMHACHVEGHIRPRQWIDKPIMEWFNFLEAKHTEKKEK